MFQTLQQWNVEGGRTRRRRRIRKRKRRGRRRRRRIQETRTKHRCQSYHSQILILLSDMGRYSSVIMLFYVQMKHNNLPSKLISPAIQAPWKNLTKAPYLLSLVKKQSAVSFNSIQNLKQDPLKTRQILSTLSWRSQINQNHVFVTL